MRFCPVASPLLLVSLAIALPSTALAIDPPHDQIPGYATNDCAPCHSSHGFGTPASEICLSCHGESWTVVEAPLQATHADYITGTGNYDFELECTACHDPHYQRQDNMYGTSYGMYIKTTISENITVTDNTVSPPETETVAIDADIRFTSSSEFDNDDGDPSNDICNVCHTLTNHHQNDGTAPGGQDHHNGWDCTSCHEHINGFAQSCGGGMGGGGMGGGMGGGGMSH